uniref:Ribonuclease H-like domain-containing protein n=1 Tax=Tanacetum cinerariifolium TaxID=118510 RepID=A0A6L2J306_TANCI|nr:ribonuclease H-like domain-containing protein [Tanacetum cinerariifolium]
MRIEQYFLMTDYLLWEVILSGDSPAPTRVINTVLQPVAPTTAEQRLARKNELKARVKKRFEGNTKTKKVQKTLLKQQYENFTGFSSKSLDQIHDRLQKLISQLEILRVSLSQEDINLKFLRSLPTEWRTHTLIWRNKIDMKEQSLDDLFNSLKIYKAKVKSSSFGSTSTQNIAFVSSSNTDSTNEPVSTAASVSVIDADDLEEMDLKWQMAMLTVRARRFLQRTGRNLGANGPTSIGFDMSKRLLHQMHWFPSVMVWAAMIRVFRQMRNLPTMLSWPFLLQVLLLTIRYQPGNGYHIVSPPYTGTFMPPKPDLVFHNAPNDVKTIHTAFNVELSPTKPDNDFFHTRRSSAPIIEDWVSDSEDESETQIPHNVHSFVQPTKQVKSPRTYVKHVETSIPTANPKTVIPKPTSNGTRRNRKACFVCKSLDHLIKDCDYHEKKIAQTIARNHAQRGNHKQYARMPLSNPQRHVRLVSIDVPKINVSRPRQAKPIITKPNSPPRRHINHSPSPKVSTFPPKVTAVKAPMVNAAKGIQGKWEWKPKYPILDHFPEIQGNPQHALKDKGVIDSRCSRHMTGNMSYLFDFKELNGGYVAFGGNPKGGKIFRKGKIRTGKLDFDDVYFVKELKFNLFSVSHMSNKKNSVLFTDTECLVLSPEFKLPDENQMLLRVPKENNMYQVNLKNIVPSRDLICLFAKATLDESNLWMKGIKREFSVPRTPQQNGIAERKNQTLIEAARTMLVESLLPILFWVEAVNTACYVQNRVLVTKTHNKTPYELLYGRTPSIGFMRPFGCPMTILNTLDSLGKFDGKIDERFLVGYSISSKAFKVFNSRNWIVQETLHVNFLENKPNVAGSGPTWLFDIDTLTKTNTDGDAAFDEKKSEFERRKPESELNVFPSSSAQSKKHDDKTKREAKGKSHVESLTGYRNLSAKFEDFFNNNINEDNDAGTLVPSVRQLSPNSTNTFSAAGPSKASASPTHGKSSYVDSSQLPDDLNMPELKDITYSNDEDDVGAEADFNNLETSITVSPIPTTRVHKDHPVKQIISDLSLATQTRSMTRVAKDQGGLSQINNDDFYTCMFVRFLSQEEPKRDLRTLIDLTRFPKWSRYFMVYIKLLELDEKSASTPIDTEKPLLKDPNVQVVLSGMESLKRMLHVTNILSAGYLTTPQMVLISPCLTHIKNWLVQIKRSLSWLVQKQTTLGVNIPRCDEDRLELMELTVFLLPSDEKIRIETSVVVKTVNDVMRLQALVNKKRVIITEATIRDALRLDDAEGVECLPNEEIFTELARMGYEKPSTKLTFYKAFFSSKWKFQIHTILQCMSAKRTSWNEFSSSMASAVICLSTVEQQVGKGADEVHVKDVSTTGVTAEGVVSTADDVVPIAVEEPSIPSPTPPTPPPQPSQDQPSTSQVQLTPPSLIIQLQSPQHQPQPSQDAGISIDLLQNLLDTCTTLTRKVEHLEQDKNAQALERMIADMDADVDVTLKDVAKAVQDVDVEESADIQGRQAESQPAKLQEVMEVVTTAKLITEVVTAASATITAAAPQLTTAAAPTLTTAPSAARKRKGVVIRDPEETATPSTIIHTEAKSKDKGKGILVEEPKPLKKQAQIEQDEAYAKELEAELNKNID